MTFLTWVLGLAVAMVVVGWAMGLNAGAVSEAEGDHGGAHH